MWFIKMKVSDELIMQPGDFLHFTFMENTPVASAINLKNNSESFLTFKVKTNAPNSYYVRPSVGVLAPNEGKVVNVVLHSLKEFPVDMKDKFLVNYCLTNSLKSESSSAEINTFWQNLTREKRSVKSIMLKVKVDESNSNQENNEKLALEMKPEKKNDKRLEVNNRKVESKFIFTSRILVACLLLVYIFLKILSII
jgi:hypothetical protein